ncbi:hypothetical protein [Nocardiopsis sp. M1B1]|uniref:hypothetical protein n=1 Tax=Nocardiopsis sp. M1B1 TaxID=3450454 RepID=UPI00403A477F
MGGVAGHFVVGERAENRVGAQGGTVEGDRAVVADDVVGRDEGRLPALPGRQDAQPGAFGVGEPGTHLPGAVAVPDVGVQGQRHPVLVHREFLQQAEGQVGPAAEQGGRTPGGADQHESAPSGLQVVAVALTPGEPGQDAVVGGVPGDEGRAHRLGAGGVQPVELLGVGEHQGLRDECAVAEQGLA